MKPSPWVGLPPARAVHVRQGPRDRGQGLPGILARHQTPVKRAAGKKDTVLDGVQDVRGRFDDMGTATRLASLAARRTQLRVGDRSVHQTVEALQHRARPVHRVDPGPGRAAVGRHTLPAPIHLHVEGAGPCCPDRPAGNGWWCQEPDSMPWRASRETALLDHVPGRIVWRPVSPARLTLLPATAVAPVLAPTGARRRRRPSAWPPEPPSARSLPGPRCKGP